MIDEASSNRITSSGARAASRDDTGHEGPRPPPFGRDGAREQQQELALVLGILERPSDEGADHHRRRIAVEVAGEPRHRHHEHGVGLGLHGAMVAVEQRVPADALLVPRDEQVREVPGLDQRIVDTLAIQRVLVVERVPDEHPARPAVLAIAIGHPPNSEERPHLARALDAPAHGRQRAQVAQVIALRIATGGCAIGAHRGGHRDTPVARRKEQHVAPAPG
jgi:hypothetical protein